MTDRPGTSDLYDIHQEALESCELQLRQLGGVRHFEGPIVTLRAFEDNLRLKEIGAEPGGTTRSPSRRQRSADTSLGPAWSNQHPRRDPSPPTSVSRRRCRTRPGSPTSHISA